MTNHTGPSTRLYTSLTSKETTPASSHICSETRYGSITSEWEHFAEWKRLDKGSLEAEVMMTDRNDFDSQIYRTFVGCGIADDNTPRAASGDDLGR